MTEMPYTAQPDPNQPQTGQPYQSQPPGHPFASQRGPAQPPYKPLRRVRDDRIVAGVCAGIGRYFNVDPTAVRVAFALIAVMTWGAALLAYPVMWFLMPEEPAPAQQWPTTTAAG